MTVKSNLTALDEFSDGKPTSVSLVLNEEDIARIKDAITFLKKTNGVSVKIHKTGDLYFNNKNEQHEEFLNHSDEDYKWEESNEGLIIMLNSIYYTATNDYDSSDVLESEDLTDLYPELSSLFKDEQEEKVNEDKKLAINLLNSLQEDCDMAISGDWDCSSDEGKEGFEAMIKNINTIKVIIKKHIK